MAQRVLNNGETLNSIRTKINDNFTDLENSVVHKTGNEDVSGIKTFSTKLNRKTQSIDVTSTTGESEETVFSVVDRNNKEIGLLNATRSTINNTVRLRAVNNNIPTEVGVTSPWADVRVSVDDNKNVRAAFETGSGMINQSLTTTTTSTDDRTLACVGLVNRRLQNYVAKTGNETVNGVKTFTEAPIIEKTGNAVSSLNLKNTVLDHNANPSTIVGRSVNFTDKNNLTTGSVYNFKTTTGDVYTNIVAKNKNGVEAVLSVVIKPDGTKQLIGETPPTSDSSDKLATTYYVNSKLASSVATTTEAGMLRVASASDEIDCQCDDAAITPQNLYELEDYRLANTAYALDDTVNCPYHANYMLVCIQAGTTSSQSLDTHSVTINQEITDGTVKWKVKNSIGNREYFTENNWQYSSSLARQVLELGTIRPVIAVYKQLADGTYTMVTNVDVEIAQNEVQTLKVITKFTGFVMTV